MQKIRKGDQVVVTRGSEKGKRGTVLRVFESGKVLDDGRKVRVFKSNGEQVDV